MVQLFLLFSNVGNSIYQLLQRCLEVLRREFSELKTVMADQLMYVKEDLILPHHYTFYDFIVTKVINKNASNYLLRKTMCSIYILIIMGTI